MPPWMRYFFLLCLGFNLGAWPVHVSEDPQFYYMLFGFLYSFYARLKTLFLDPSLEGSVYLLPTLKDKAPYYLTWNDIVLNISGISFCSFGRPVSNQLGDHASKKSFPQIAKRYMSNRLFSAAKTNPEVATFAGALGGVIGYGVSEVNTHSRHKEVL